MTTNDHDRLNLKSAGNYNILLILVEKKFFTANIFMQVLNQNVGSEKLSTPPIRRGLFVVRGKKTRREGDTGKGKDRPEGLRSFRQRPVKLLKSFLLPVGSVS